eukprot:SAG31_NODE_244_length_19246_cov_20.233823_24_plen_84_part_00
MSVCFYLSTYCSRHVLHNVHDNMTSCHIRPKVEAIWGVLGPADTPGIFSIVFFLKKKKKTSLLPKIFKHFKAVYMGDGYFFLN